MTRRRHLPLLLIAALLGLVTPRLSLAKPRSARSEALHLAQQGVKDYSASRYAEALEKFQKAYQLFPNPPLILNLSRTYLKLGQCDEAIRYGEIYATDSTASESGIYRDSWLQRVHLECVDVDITTTPTGASLWIKGVPSASPTTTPWHGKLIAGSHSIILKATGFAEHDETLVVQQQQPLHVEIRLDSTEPPLLPPEEAVTVTPKTTPEPAPTTPPAAKPPPAVDLTLKTPPRHEAPATTTRKGMPPARAVGWAAIAIGGAALVTAIALGAVSTNDYRSLHTSEHSTAQVNQLVKATNSLATGANVLFGVGGGIAAGGVVLVIVF